MGEVWPEAQRHVAAELGTGMPDAIVFASNTHDFLVRLAAACPRALGQAAGADQRRRIPQRPPPVRALGRGRLARARAGRRRARGDVRSALPRSGERGRPRPDPRQPGAVRQRPAVRRGRRACGARQGRRAVGGDRRLPRLHGASTGRSAPRPPQSAFYLGGGYKYAMAGEGCGFMHAPPGFGPRPPVTGWFAEFEDLSLPPGSVGYAPDAMRFMGATFDPSGLYRFNAVRRMLADERPDHRAHLGARRRASGAAARAPRAAPRLARRRAAQSAGRRPARPLPCLPQPAAQHWQRELGRGAAASSTCAATCFGSASRSITTKPTSTASPTSLRELHARCADRRDPRAR